MDSGATDPYWTKGGIVKLLSFLRGETEEETRAYLRAVYAPDFRGTEDDLRLDIRLPIEKERQGLDPSILRKYAYRHPYLVRRCVSERVQRMMRVGYDRESRAITIPWFAPDGRLVAIKYRKVNSKVFWYARGGRPIRECVYGIDIVYRTRAKTVVLCESEIDAMSAMAVGFPAVAVGGASISREQAEAIIRSPIESIVVAADNDDAGMKLLENVYNKLCGYVDMSYVDWGDYEVKDINETLVRYGIEETKKLLGNGVRGKKFLGNIYQKDKKPKPEDDI